jgi:hypothetical protein
MNYSSKATRLSLSSVAACLGYSKTNDLADAQNRLLNNQPFLRKTRKGSLVRIDANEAKFFSGMDEPNKFLTFQGVYSYLGSIAQCVKGVKRGSP